MAGNLKNKAGEAKRTRKLLPTDGVKEQRAYISELREMGGGSISCGHGLMIRVYAQKATFNLNWMPPRRPGEKREAQRTAVLGDVGPLTLTQARAKAEELLAKIRAEKHDPVAVRKAARTNAETAALQRRAKEASDARELQKIIGGEEGEFSVLATGTTQQCAEAFLKHALDAEISIEHRKNITRDLNGFIAHAGIGSSPAAAVTDSMLKAFLNGCGPAKKLHAYGVAFRFLDWLRRHDVITKNVAEKVKKPGKPTPRTGKYEAADVKALWEGAEKLPAAKRDFLRFIILVPLRRQEAANLTIGGIYEENGRYEVRLTADEVKNKEPIRIPLVGEALNIVLAAIKGRETDRDAPIFKLASGETMKAWSKFTTAVREKTGVKTFQWHDNRRTFSTISGEHELGDFNIVDGLLNHKSAEIKSGVKGAYQQAALIAPRTRILRRWDETIAHAIAKGKWPPRDFGDDTNVTSINAARRA